MSLLEEGVVLDEGSLVWRVVTMMGGLLEVASIVELR